MTASVLAPTQVVETDDPARPRTPGGNVGPFVRSLAADHGVEYAETASDRQCTDFARLSDAATQPDGNERLLAALLRAGVITRAEHDDLHDAYIRNDLGLE